MRPLTDQEIDDTVEAMVRRGYDDEEIEAFIKRHPYSWERVGSEGAN